MDEKKGIHNWRNLFKKPTLNDWVVTIMLVFVLILVFFYKLDVDGCVGVIEKLTDRMESCGCPLEAPPSDYGTGRMGIDVSYSDENTTSLPMDV